MIQQAFAGLFTLPAMSAGTPGNHLLPFGLQPRRRIFVVADLHQPFRFLLRRRLKSASSGQQSWLAGVFQQAVKVEHRLFSFISSNWRGEPLIDYETVAKLISGTRTAAGLRVVCRLDRGNYATGIEVSAEKMAAINLERNKFHGEWNYKIYPGINRPS